LSDRSASAVAWIEPHPALTALAASLVSAIIAVVAIAVGEPGLYAVDWSASYSCPGMPSESDSGWSAFDESLRSLGEAQLQIQAATSIGYDTQALGLMAVDAALAGVVLALQSTLESFYWIASVSVAVGSIVACMVSLSFGSTDQLGQDLAAALADPHTADEIQATIVRSIADAVAANRPTLIGRRTATKVALGLLLISLMLAVLAKAIP